MQARRQRELSLSSLRFAITRRQRWSRVVKSLGLESRWAQFSFYWWELLRLEIADFFKTEFTLRPIYAVYGLPCIPAVIWAYCEKLVSFLSFNSLGYVIANISFKIIKFYMGLIGKWHGVCWNTVEACFN